MGVGELIFSLLGAKGMGILVAVGAAIAAYFGIKRSGANEQKAKRDKEDLKESRQVDDLIQDANADTDDRPLADRVRDSKRNRLSKK